MILKLLKSIFIKNWPTKLLCLVAAGALWVYVASSENTVAKFPGALRIKAVNTPANLVAIYDAKTVDIKVMAESTVWQKLSAETFSANIDLSGMSVGTHEVPVNVTTSISGVQIVEKTPDRILVTLEPVISKDVPIAKRIEGSAAEGMVPGSITFTPDKVRIKGAQSVIENINEAVAKIVLNGENADFTRNISLAVFDDRNEELPDIEIWPSEIEAGVSIVKGTNIKTVGIKVKVSGKVMDNYYISNIATSPGALDINGVRDTVLNTKYIETYPIDVSNQSGTIIKDVMLSIPDGISVLGNDSGKVHVTISLSPFRLSQEFSVSNFKLTNSSFSTPAYSPSIIKVTAEGVPSKLGTLLASDFSINIDLSGKLPDANGEISYSISADNIKAPEGVSVTAVEPKVIKISVK